MAESSAVSSNNEEGEKTLVPGSLKEYDPLTELLSQIPKKVQRGMHTLTETLEITCIDANQDFIALGTNIGIVFLYDRSKSTIERLRSDDKNAHVCSVRLHHGLDHLVAIGYTSGTIYVFQLPSMMIGHSKQLERFVVHDLHNTVVTCLAWSTNGMRLFSGDNKGSVGCTDVDFYEGQCKSSILLIESETEIVQLDPAHRSLLVSTLHRCIICRMGTKDQLVQVGSKDRKILGEFGGVFIPAMCKPEDAQLYCTRPGFRLWKSAIDGTVNNTFMFKELLSQAHNEIPVGAFVVTSIEKAAPASQFGPLLLFHGQYLVTWNQSCLYVLDPERTCVVGTQKHVGQIKSVISTGDEIFILRRNTNRDLIRISTKPLPETGSKILKELHHQAEKRENEEQKEKGDKHSSKNSSTESLTEKPKDKKKTSPFKFLQDNIVEKMKKIPKPNEIKEMIQEKVNRDSQSEQTSSRYSQEYVFETEGKSDSDKHSETLQGDLPPVIKLDSPDLLSVEIAVDAAILSYKEQSSMKKVPSVEQFAARVGNQTHDSEVELLADQSSSKTGSGAHSALRKLQDEHHEEESSDTVLSRKSFSEESEELVTSSVELSQERKIETSTTSSVELSQERKIETSTVSNVQSEAFSNINLTPDEVGIVFSRKIKPKGKKKKKTSKDRTSTRLEVEQDRLSVNSIASNNSDTSETVNIAGVNEATTENGSSQPDKSLQESLLSQKHHPQDVTDVASMITVKAESICEIDKSIEKRDLNTDSILKNNDSDDKIDGVKSDDDAVMETIVDEQQSAAVEKSDSTETHEALNRNSAIDSSLVGKNEKVLEEGVNQATCDTDVRLKTDSENKEKHKTVDTLTPVALSVVAASDSSQRSKSCDTLSNLDKEIARLNSYLSQTSDSSTTECEASDSSSTQSLSKSMLARRDVESILLKDVHRYEELEDEITRNFRREDTEYKETDLDKQLKQLDFEASNTSSDLISANPPVLTPATSPSIYTLYKTRSISQDDFYSEYGPNSPESLSSHSSLHPNDSMTDSIHILDVPQNVSMGKSVNMWTEISAQGNMLSLCASTTHVWYTDKSANIFYSTLTGPGLSWRKASGYATQVSVSPMGNIVWRLYKGVAYAGTKITAKSPEGMKWVQAVQGDVAYICVDETCAWYIKTNFDVMIQKGLSRERPCYTAKQVDCPFKLKQIVCQAGVVWALTEEFQWIYRDGVTQSCLEGTSWKKGISGSSDRLFSCVSLGDGNIGWAVDVLGNMWFLCGVTMDRPRGNGIWWQVPFSGEYLMKDITTMDMLKAFTKKLDPQNLTYILHHQRGGLICGRSGTWYCPEYKHLLHVCRGSIEGHYWDEAQPEGLSLTLVWKLVEARNVRNDNGLLWIQQGSGDIFTYTPDRQNCASVQSPRPGSTFLCISACPEAVWVLLENGDVYIRTGIGKVYPQGGGWFKLDLTQIDSTRFVHLSCSSTSVWAVDNEGGTFHRIGVKAPNDHSLNAAWLPIDNGDTVFTQIIAGPQDWMVWAVDNRRQVYVRSQITTHMPIGRHWVHVPGTLATQLALSDHYVWALSPAGELLCRYGVSTDNATGDYWKKVPGNFTYISVSPSNQLWGINREGLLLRRHTKYIVKDTAMELESSQRSAARGTSTGSDEGDWELV